MTSHRTLTYHAIRILLSVLVLMAGHSATAQTYGQKKSIALMATVDSNDHLQLFWNIYQAVDSFVLSKRNSSGWSRFARLDSSQRSYLDTSIVSGTSCEYKLVGYRSSGDHAYGYLFSGLEVQAWSHGTLVVVVEEALADSLDLALRIYSSDLRAEGYAVVIQRFNSSLDHVALADTLKAIYQREINVEAFFLLGALPYAYTGKIAPDGHGDHMGAWPSDMIYGDMDATYTDISVNYTNLTSPRHTNSTSDTKYDQSYLLSDVDVQIGRLDMSRLPAFSQSEVNLYKNYFNKLHDYKTGAFVPENKGIIDDNFTAFTEGFSQNGYRNFSPLTHKDSVSDADLLTTLTSGSALWSFGCGYGTYTNLTNVFSTSQLANNTLKGVFGLILGSYNGDVDTTDNLMRAMLANGNFLTAGWAGRPNWFMHHMGLGKSIGNSTMISQNNTTAVYEPTGNFATMMHVMLLGDPSLKNHYTANVQSLSTIRAQNKDTAHLTWNTQTGVLGYNVYRSKEEFGDYVKRNSSLLTTNSYDDPTSADTTYFYRIETVELVENSSGSYYESSVGAYIESNKNAPVLPVTLLSFTAQKAQEVIQLNWQVADEVDFSHYSLEKFNPNTAQWMPIAEIAAQGAAHELTDYSHIDQNPVIGKNIYRLKMVDYDASFEYSDLAIVLFEDGFAGGQFIVTPTLASAYIEIECDMLNYTQTRTFTITDISGKVVLTQEITDLNRRLNITELPKGMYFVNDDQNKVVAQRFVKSN